jgi:GDPmannose 4,6-dehydratase
LNWEDFVEVTDRYKRPAEVPALLGDSSKARRILGWKPEVNFDQLCEMMLESDLKAKGFTMEQARQKAKTLFRGRK